MKDPRETADTIPNGMPISIETRKAAPPSCNVLGNRSITNLMLGTS